MLRIFFLFPLTGIYFLISIQSLKPALSHLFTKEKGLKIGIDYNNRLQTTSYSAINNKASVVQYATNNKMSIFGNILNT